MRFIARLNLRRSRRGAHLGRWFFIVSVAAANSAAAVTISGDTADR